MYRILTITGLGLLLGACQASPERPVSASAEVETVAASASPATAAGLDRILNDRRRSEANRARDRYRHPAETLQFFGIAPDQSVLEITPGGGWYAELLAPYLAGSGQYTAAIWDDSAPNFPPFFAGLNRQLREQLASDPDYYGAARLLPFNTKAPAFGADGSFDAVLTFRNVHNWAMAGNADAWFKAFFAALKPGGVLGVVDHRAKPGTTLEATLKSGYLTEDYVIGLATAAGFVLEAKSEINANPADTSQHPAGVWTLPPTLRLKEQDQEKYLAIGESDRMTLRFRKPDNDILHAAED
ncbi:MAG: class I SAM-dependent methyltransferase [Lysobacterales bacterium]